MSAMYSTILTILLIRIPTYTLAAVECDTESSSCECVLAEKCNLKCSGEDACKGSDYTLKCAPNQACDVDCIGNNACTDATLDANGATDIFISCKEGTAPCVALVYNCGSGHCSMRCKGTAPGSCVDASIIFNSALSFECLGTNCPQTLIDLLFTAAPTAVSTSPTFAPTLVTFAPSTNAPTLAPNIASSTMTHDANAPNTSSKSDDYVTIIVIVSVCVLGLAAICFGIYCIYKKKQNDDSDSDDSDSDKDEDEDEVNDDINYNATNTRYSVSNNALAQTTTNKIVGTQRPQSMQMMHQYNNQYNVTRQQSAPAQHVMPPQQQQLQSQPNMNMGYNNNNMQQMPQYSNPQNMIAAQPPHANTMQSFPQYYNNPQNVQYSNANSNANMNNQQYAMQTAAQVASQMSMNSDGSDASLYEKQQQYAQEEVAKTKSMRSVNTDVSLYETQAIYAQQELADLHEAKEVDTFDDTQAEQVGNVQVENRRLSAATDVSLYETQQQYLQQEIAEMKDVNRVNGGRSVSKRKSSRV